MRTLSRSRKSLLAQFILIFILIEIGRYTPIYYDIDVKKNSNRHPRAYVTLEYVKMKYKLYLNNDTRESILVKSTHVIYRVVTNI